MIDTNKIVASSGFSGFKNYNSVPFSAAYVGGNITAGSFIGPVRAITALDNTNAVSEIQIQFVGLETFSRLLPGTFFVNYPNAASTNYQIEVFSYFTGGNVTVDAYISNETASTVTVPAITFSCRAFLFLAPF